MYLLIPILMSSQGLGGTGGSVGVGKVESVVQCARKPLASMKKSAKKRITSSFVVLSMTAGILEPQKGPVRK